MVRLLLRSWSVFCSLNKWSTDKRRYSCNLWGQILHDVVIWSKNHPRKPVERKHIPPKVWKKNKFADSGFEAETYQEASWKEQLLSKRLSHDLAVLISLHYNGSDIQVWDVNFLIWVLSCLLTTQVVGDLYLGRVVSSQTCILGDLHLWRLVSPGGEFIVRGAFFFQINLSSTNLPRCTFHAHSSQDKLSSHCLSSEPAMLIQPP